MPELIVKVTGGQFQETVNLIEQAERTGWYELHDELLARAGQPSLRVRMKDELL